MEKKSEVDKVIKMPYDHDKLCGFNYLSFGFILTSLKQLGFKHSHI